jgi:hypothetical protein
MIKNYSSITFLFLLVLSLGSILAQSETEENHGHEALFEKAEQIINKNTPCDTLEENDLEALGEYFMEQMHPGEAHKIMDARMGGEGSESLKNAHINMGVSFYCNDEEGEYGNMMNSGMHYFGYIFHFLLALVLILLMIWLVKNKIIKKS